MKKGQTREKKENTGSELQITGDKKSILDELMEESNYEEDDFILDGVHFKLSPIGKTSQVQDPNLAININQLSKQINELHTLTFSDTKDLSDQNLKDKMKAKILSKGANKLK